MIHEKSCGAVVHAERDGQRLYLIEVMRKGHLSLCKGHVEGDETEYETAAREIREETGLSVEFEDGFRETIEYSPYEGCMKTVVFFLAKADGTEVTAQEEEVREILWLPFEEAAAALTFESDRETLRKAETFLRLEFKRGCGWRACRDAERGIFTAERSGPGYYDLYEITEEIFEALEEGMNDSDSCHLIDEGRHLYMDVNDRCGPPYTVVLDDDYETLCPWARAVRSGRVWPAELTDAAVELFASEEKNREQRRRKREEREKKDPGSEG